MIFHKVFQDKSPINLRLGFNLLVRTFSPNFVLLVPVWSTGSATYDTPGPVIDE